MMLDMDLCLPFQLGTTLPWTRTEDTIHANCCIRAMGACRGNNPFQNFVRNDAWRHARMTLSAQFSNFPSEKTHRILYKFAPMMPAHVPVESKSGNYPIKGVD